MRLLVMPLLVFTPLISYADVYKCIKDSKVVFQDVECDSNIKVFSSDQNLKKYKILDNSIRCVPKNIECEDKLTKSAQQTQQASGLMDDISLHTAMKSLPKNATIYLCYSGGKDLLFMEVPCLGPEKSANVWIEKADGWGRVIPKLPSHNVNVSIMGVSSQEIDSLADAEKQIQMPESIKNKVKSFNKLTGKYKITKISAYQGVFYKHTAEMCLKDFYFNHEDLINYGAYIDHKRCSFSDFKVVGNEISYKKQCIEQGKKASNMISISRNGLNGKFEQRIQDIAPSSEIENDYFLEVIYIGGCYN